MLFSIYPYFSNWRANIVDYASDKIFVEAGITSESFGQKDVFFIFDDDLESFSDDKKKETKQCFLSEPDINNSNQHLLVKLNLDVKFFRSERYHNLQEFIKSFIQYKLSKIDKGERKEKKEKIAKILFSFSTDTEMALISKWFRELSHTLGVKIEKGDYEFYLLNVRFDRQTINALDEINNILGLEGILVEEDIKKFKIFKDTAEYFQIKKGRVVNPFALLDEL